MKLSILIPMYNAKDYIGNCLESLIHQNIPEDDYEIIIMDDGSKDNSVDIVSEFIKNHKNIKLHKEPNSGAYNTRNKLLKLAKGDYIYNLDADDYIVHNCLKELLDCAEQNNLDVIGFKTQETSSLENIALNELISKKHLTLYDGLAFLEAYPLMRHEPWWYFVRSGFLSENNLAFNSNQYNADVTFTLKMFLEAKKVGYFDISIHRYVQSGDSIMRSKDLEIVRKRLEYMQMMILNKSKLINTVKSQSSSEVLVQNLSHRRDVFTFFNITKMLRGPFSLSYMKATITKFKDVGAYPMNDFNRFRYNTFQYRILRKILNNASMLYFLISVRRIFSKSIK
ncbi:glycosyltransferase [Winogradskyella sp.]|uniref:glycosyltransferase family 2 protein n=1 Tax=Winogradskyella sp. TaxID=1883156 RepID=UPI00260F2552|nr:glycosyltransferase [Winogradskyella sp.]